MCGIVRHRRIPVVRKQWDRSIISEYVGAVDRKDVALGIDDIFISVAMTVKLLNIHFVAEKELAESPYEPCSISAAIHSI